MNTVPNYILYCFDELFFPELVMASNQPAWQSWPLPPGSYDIMFHFKYFKTQFHKNQLFKFTDS